MITRRARLQWTSANVEHIARHGVSTEDVEHMLFSRGAFVRRGEKGYYRYFGRDRGGRYLMAVLDLVESDVYYVVTARPMTGAERRLYRRSGGA